MARFPVAHSVLTARRVTRYPLPASFLLRRCRQRPIRPGLCPRNARRWNFGRRYARRRLRARRTGGVPRPACIIGAVVVGRSGVKACAFSCAGDRVPTGTDTTSPACGSVRAATARDCTPRCRIGAVDLSQASATRALRRNRHLVRGASAIGRDRLTTEERLSDVSNTIKPSTTGSQFLGLM
jgi:hypothetical protein